MDKLNIHYLSLAQYENLETIDEDALYLTPEESDIGIPVLVTAQDPNQMSNLTPGTLVISTFNSTTN